MSHNAKSLVEYIDSCKAGDRTKTLVLVGKERSGKTTLATAIAIYLQKSLKRVQSNGNFESFICPKNGYSDSPILSSPEWRNDGEGGTHNLIVVNVEEFLEEDFLLTEEEALKESRKIIDHFCARAKKEKEAPLNLSGPVFERES